ncbi:hypothetical protein L195_g030413 [Trifolium pratense]|uniref:Uncharacterized protein n=1 Tax=Trifolium pratense TaxID=57577 RepID=A0A2K3L7I1_TRIPR|nr:hypothetical protein L195_g030413 [Trifolium pratense]
MNNGSLSETRLLGIPWSLQVVSKKVVAYTMSSIVGVERCKVDAFGKAIDHYKDGGMVVGFGLLKFSQAVNASLRCSRKIKLGIERERIIPEGVSRSRERASTTTLVLPDLYWME